MKNPNKKWVFFYKQEWRRRKRKKTGTLSKDQFFSLSNFGEERKQIRDLIKRGPVFEIKRKDERQNFSFLLGLQLFY
jgi:hypothetical protein